MNYYKLLNLVLALVIINLVLLFFGESPDRDISDSTVKVGLVFDVGGLGDKSFNDLAYKGLIKAQQDLSIYVEYLEPGEAADREGAMRMLAARGFDLVIGVGFIFSSAITTIARDFPKIHFACIDYAVRHDKNGQPIPLPKNLAALKFREEEGSFLVGAIAALTSKTNKIGFIGGMDIPLIHKFEAGYLTGARAARPNIKVLINYAGVTPLAFADPGKGRELGLAQYGRGVDIIFHASGSTGLGVFGAARRMNKLAIGVDADQYKEAPGHILTSMVKGVEVAVFEVIKSVTQEHFKGGILSFGLKEDGVGFIYDDHNRSLISKTTIERVKQFRDEITLGKRSVPSTREGS